MTGLRASLRGSSFRNASPAARISRLESKAEALRATLAIMTVCLGARALLRRKMSGHHHEMLHDGAERGRRKELQSAHDQDHADDQPDEERIIGREGTGGDRRFYFRRDG